MSDEEFFEVVETTKEVFEAVDGETQQFNEFTVTLNLKNHLGDVISTHSVGQLFYVNADEKFCKDYVANRAAKEFEPILLKHIEAMGELDKSFEFKGTLNTKPGGVINMDASEYYRRASVKQSVKREAEKLAATIDRDITDNIFKQTWNKMKL